MPTVRLRYRMSETGLVVLGPREMVSQKGLRRAKGIWGKRSRSFTSRAGSSLIIAEDAVSLVYWQGSYYGRVGTNFRKLTGGGGAPFTIKNVLAGELTYCTTPSTSGFPDVLFVAGGGQFIFKLDAAGLSSNIGIMPPTTACVPTAGVAGNLKGVYKYYYTFYSTVTGTESNPAPVATVTANFQQVTLTGVSVTTLDPQVTSRRIYRTVGNGSVAFLIGTSNNMTVTTYTDNTPDIDLESHELEFDNVAAIDPKFDLQQVAGSTHMGRVWWTQDQAVGCQGRIYYSPVGRAEVIQGYIEPSSNDDPIQRIVVWNGSLYGFSKQRIFEVVGGDEPFSYRDITGSLGTDFPWTIVTTPYGILYRSRDDDFRNFNGVLSNPLEPGALGDTLKGEPSDTYPTGFSGIFGGFANDEYWVGDKTGTTLCLFLGGSPNPPSWREVGGLGIKGFHVNTAGQVAVSAGGKVLLFDSISLVTDAGAAIPWEMEVATTISDIVMQGIVQRIIIDHQLNGAFLSVTRVMDTGTNLVWGFSGTVREVTEYAASFPGRLLALRLSSTLSQKIEIFEIAIDYYIPGERPNELAMG